jgi:HK97 family phage portal protein
VKLEIQLFGRTLELSTKGVTLRPLSNTGSWWPVIRESFTGAWQHNVEIGASTALSYYAVYSCVRLISTDMGKMCFRLVKRDSDGVWTETESPAFSPVLRKPNRYQTFNKYVEQYIISKLLHGNAYVLKQRDGRGVVVALYVLDPTRVTPLVTPDGAVYYELKRDDLSGLPKDTVTVPASEIIHDTMIAPYHPLIGLSPLYAASLPATQGLSIQSGSKTFFENSGQPSGILTAPVGITKEQAASLLERWKARTPGDIAVLAGELKYQSLSLTAVDSQLIEQLRMTAEQVCGPFGVPPYLVDIGPPPPYANFEPLLLKYHSQCIQSLATNFEKSHDEGLGLIEKIDGTQYGTEFDIDDLIWMDTATRVTSAKTSIDSGGMSPNEARFKYYGLGPVPGGDTPYMQQQNFSLAALQERDANDPFSKPAAPTPAQPANADEDAMPEAASLRTLLRKEFSMRRAA